MAFLENQTGFHQKQSMKSLCVTTVFSVISDDLAKSQKNMSRSTLAKLGMNYLNKQTYDIDYRRNQSPIFPKSDNVDVTESANTC